MGSPLAVFLALRGLRPQDDVEDHVLPKSVCKRLVNIYHPADPVVRKIIHVMLLSKVILTFKSVAIPVKAIEQYFHVVLFIMLYKVALTLKYVDETLVCDHSNESY